MGVNCLKNTEDIRITCVKEMESMGKKERSALKPIVPCAPQNLKTTITLHGAQNCKRRLQFT